MADDQRAKAAKLFGPAFMAEARATPALPSNSAVALQKRANDRPIPTYKDGGKVARKSVGGTLAAARAKRVGTDPAPRPVGSSTPIEKPITRDPGPQPVIDRARQMRDTGRRKDGGEITKKAAGGAAKIRKGVI